MVKIGVFDSGVGGFTVLKAIKKWQPKAHILYLADFGYAPYGPRCAADITQRSHHIIQWFLQKGVSLVVVACHTSSSVLYDLEANHWPCRVMTMIEPTVAHVIQKAQQNNWQKGVGFFGTLLTVQKNTLAKAFQEQGFTLPVTGVACPGLAELIEQRAFLEAQNYVKNHVFSAFSPHPVDVLIYGCTHYPFIDSWLQQNLPVSIDSLMDPAEAIGRTVHAWYEQQSPLGTGPEVQFYYTGSPEIGQKQLTQHGNVYVHGICIDLG